MLHNAIMCRIVSTALITGLGVASLLDYSREVNIRRRFRTFAWQLIPLFGALNRRGLNSIKMAYNPSRPADWVSKNSVCQLPCYRRTRRSSLQR